MKPETHPDIKLPLGTLSNVPAKHADHVAKVLMSTFNPPRKAPMIPSVISRILKEVPEFLDNHGDWTTNLRLAREFSTTDPELYSEYKKILLEDLDEEISIIHKPMSYRDLAAAFLQMEDVDSIASFEDSHGDVLHVYTDRWASATTLEIARIDDHQAFWYNDNEGNPMYQSMREEIIAARSASEE